MPIRAQPPAWSPLSAGAILSGLAGGPKAVARLAELVRLELGTRDVLLVDSGTSALTLALDRAARGRGVALPAYGCFDLVTAAVGAGVRIHFYDLDPRTLGPEPDSFGRVLAARPGAVVVAHLYGVPIDLAPWKGELAAADIAVVDDAAQAVGAAIGPTGAGATGDLGVLSFGRGKGRTGGSGGALVVGSSLGGRLLAPLLAAPLPPSGGRLGNVARLAVQWLLGRPALYRLPASIPWLALGETRYRPPRAPRAIGPGAAAVVARVWHRSLAAAADRRRVAARWTGAVAGCRGVEPILPGDHAVPGWLRYPVVVAEELGERLRSPAARRLGVMPGYPLALPRLPDAASSRAPGDRTGWPGADVLSKRLFTLPTHRWIDDDVVAGVRLLLE